MEPLSKHSECTGCSLWKSTALIRESPIHRESSCQWKFEGHQSAVCCSTARPTGTATGSAADSIGAVQIQTIPQQRALSCTAGYSTQASGNTSRERTENAQTEYEHVGRPGIALSSLLFRCSLNDNADLMGRRAVIHDERCLNQAVGLAHERVRRCLKSSNYPFCIAHDTDAGGSVLVQLP